MLLPSGTEEPKPDIMGTRLLADDPGQEAVWLDELWVCVGLIASHFLPFHSQSHS